MSKRLIMDDIINHKGYVCKDCPENGDMAGQFISFEDYAKDYENWPWGGLPGHCNDDGTPLTDKKDVEKVVNMVADVLHPEEPKKEAVKAKADESKPKKTNKKK
jgi:hypothetical protein